MITAIVVPVDVNERMFLAQLDATDLPAYRSLIGDGNLEHVALERPYASLYIDEDGKHKNLPVNERLTALAWVHQASLRDRQDPIAGPGFITGVPDALGYDLDAPEDLRHLLFEAKRFKVEVQTAGDPKWYGNDMRYEVWLDAYIEAISLAMRWTQAEEVRVVPELPDELRDQWYEIGMDNTWIKMATDPPFTRNSFKGCYSIEELADWATAASWGIGTAFYYRDLCFIQQVNAGDEWLTIRHGIPFESISFHPHIAKGTFPDLIRRLLAATKEQCKELTY